MVENLINSVLTPFVQNMEFHITFRLLGHLIKMELWNVNIAIYLKLHVHYLFSQICLMNFGVMLCFVLFILLIDYL